MYDILLPDILRVDSWTGDRRADHWPHQPKLWQSDVIRWFHSGNNHRIYLEKFHEIATFDLFSKREKIWIRLKISRKSHLFDFWSFHFGVKNQWILRWKVPRNRTVSILILWPFHFAKKISWIDWILWNLHSSGRKISIFPILTFSICVKIEKFREIDVCQYWLFFNPFHFTRKIN